MMLEGIRQFMRLLGADAAGGAVDVADDPRIAAAALLYHVCDADGLVTADESARLELLLREEFDLDRDEAGRIAEAGRRADAEAVDLYHFTSILMRHLDEPRRRRFIEALWEVSFVDGGAHELEDNLIWRIAELLGVSTRERMEMKQVARLKTAQS